jgi:hemoglobin-like flavoprotein
MDTLQINLIRYSWERILRRPDGMLGFYERLFEAAPETRRMFGTDITKQSEKLAYTISFVVENLERMDTIRESIEDLGRVHNRLQVKAEHYELVTRVLVETIAETMGEDYSDDIGRAWTTALQAIGKVMMDAPAERKVSPVKKLLSKLFPSKDIKAA